MEELVNLVKDLQEKINLLSNKNEELSSILRTKEKENYMYVFTLISNALERGDVLEEKFWNTWLAIQKDDVEQDLLQANSPTSDKLGFNFSKVVIEAVQTSITDKVDFKDEGKNKKRWISVVDKIVNNDLVSSLLKSNPITAVVSSVVSSAANFFDSKITDIKEDRRRLVGATSEILDTIDREKINDFINKMRPYIEFYNKLLDISLSYQTDLKTLEAKALLLKKSASDYYTNLLTELSFDIKKNTGPQLNELFEITKKDDLGFDFKKVLDKPAIQKGVSYVAGFTELESEVNLFKQNYNLRYKLFVSEYKAILSKQIVIDNIPGFDKDSVTKIISRIDEVINAIGAKGNKVSFEA